MSPQLIVSLITIAVVIHVILLSVAYLILLERKIASWVQDRIGPNRTGFSFGQEDLLEKAGLGRFARFHFWGLGQPLADGLKFLLKEDYTPPHVEKALFMLAPALAAIAALIGWAVIPWGGYLQWGDQVLLVAGASVNIGIIYILAVGSLAVYGVVLGGYASNNKYSFLGGLRATAQMLSYEIPLGLCVLVMILMHGTARADYFVELQAGGVWNLWYQPLVAIIFFCCLLAEANRAPFDLAEAEQELVGGYHTEYSSMKFALFFLGEYIHLVTGAAFFALLFLGGWSISPFGLWPDLAAVGGIGLVVLKFGIFAFKVFLLIALGMLIRWTIPRFRFDQLMKLAWRSLIPVTLALLLANAALVYLKQPFWTMLLANVGVFVAVVVVGPLIPQGPPVNRRVPLPGSRFHPPLPSEGG